MKISLVIFLIALALISFSGCKPQPPKSVSDIVFRAFDYRLSGPVEVVSRKYEFPNSFHGVWYSESTVLRLSPVDYSQLIARAIASEHFTKRDLPAQVVYDRDLIKWRISWSRDEKGHTISYSYSEQ